MALFKSDEDKQKEYEETLKEMENRILNGEHYEGLIGATHTGWSFVSGFRNTDKTNFKQTKFKISDDKLIIERNRQVILLSNLREIFQDNNNEAILLLNNGEGIPVRRLSSRTLPSIKFKAFLNVLNRFIEENNSNINNIETNDNNEKSEDEVDRLIELGKMYEKGLLTDEEFAAMKKKLINGN